MSHLKNFAVSASRGSTVVFIFGVVVALVGAMMLFAPAGFAQETSEAAEASVADEEYDVDALAEEIQSVEQAIEDAPAPGEGASEVTESSEFSEEPVVSKDPVSVERDGDIDTVTIDDTDFTAWHDSETDLEKVSDDALYGISRESDAKIDEIVEVEADGHVVDEDAYGFIYDDEAELEKIVIDYYGLKTTPPETLTLKVKSSEEGEYSILDEDDIPAKADVQDAGFLPDPSAEKQEKIDKAKKENRAADVDSNEEDKSPRGKYSQVEISGTTVTNGGSTRPAITAKIGGHQRGDLNSNGELISHETLYAKRLVVRDTRNALDRDLGDNVTVQKGKKGNYTETCNLNVNNGVRALESNTETTSAIELDLSKCGNGAPRDSITFWEGVGDELKITLNASSGSANDTFEVSLWGSPNEHEAMPQLPNRTRLLETSEYLDTPGNVDNITEAKNFDLALQTQVEGPHEPYRDLFINGIYIYDPEVEVPDPNRPGETIKKRQLDEALRQNVLVMKGPNVAGEVKAERVQGNEDWIKIDATQVREQRAVWEGSNNRVIVWFKGVKAVDPSDMKMLVYASPTKGEKPEDVDLSAASPIGKVGEKSFESELGDVKTHVEPLDEVGRDFKVTVTREFNTSGGTLGDEATARVDHINGTYLDNNVLTPSLKVLDADGKPVLDDEGNPIELSGRAYDRYRVADDKSDNDWGGLTFDGLEGVKVPKGGKIVVEMGFRRTAGSPIYDRENRLPLGPGEIVVDLAKTDDHFELIKEGGIEARAEATKRDDEAYEDVITIGSRSKFSGAKVTVDAPNSILTGESYLFQIGGDNNTGLEQGYSLEKKVISVDQDKVVYEVYPVDREGNRTPALVEKGTKMTVSSAFSRTPETVKTTVELSGKKLKKAADKTWTQGEGGEISLYPVGRLYPLIMTNSERHGFNGSPGPFVLKNEAGEVVSYGGLCMEPHLGYPANHADPKNDEWELFPSGYTPVDDKPLSSENQQAVGYIVNQLSSTGNGSASTARQDVINAAEDLVAAVPPEGVRDGSGRLYSGAEAYAVAYGAALNLLGYDKENLDAIFSQYTSAGNPKRDEIMVKGKKIADYVLGLVREGNITGETAYQIVRVKNSNGNPWQMVLVPGKGEGNSRMSTTAALDGDKAAADVDFGEWRKTRIGIEDVDKTFAYDRIDYVGLAPGEYTVNTQLVRIDSDDKETEVYKSEDKFTAESLAQGSWFVKVDLSNEDIRKKLKAGSRYVFKETVKDSSGQEIVKHVNTGDEAQSFWIEAGADFTFTKVSADNHEDKLKEASFVIADNKGMEGAEPVLLKAENDKTTFAIENLKVGKQYWLAETKAPNGPAGKNYQLLPEPISFKIDEEDGKLKFWSAGQWTEKDAFPFVDPTSTTDEETGQIHATANIANVWIGDLPKTGGNGIAPWLLLGGLIMAAGALMGNRRRA